MTEWAAFTALRRTAEVVDFCAVYWATLLGRCAMLSVPVLGIVLLLRGTVCRERVFLRGAVWAALLPVPSLGSLAVFYESRVFLPLLWWQSLCIGHVWIRWGYLGGAAAGLVMAYRRRRTLSRTLSVLPSETIAGERILLWDAPVSPFAAGVLSPKIVVSKAVRERMDEDGLRLILLHERTHIRLGHLWCFLLWDLLCALLWTDPFLRPCGRLLREDLEHLCDAVTIQRSGGDAVSYGRTILKALSLLGPGARDLPAAFTDTADLAGIRRRICQVRDHRPYRVRDAAAVCVGTAVALMAAALVIYRASLPRYTRLTGFSVVHIGEISGDRIGGDLEDLYTVVYDTQEEVPPPLSLHGDRAEVDVTALRALLPEDAPEDGWYYILWGGFMKLPGIGGALEAVWIDGLPEGPTAAADFHSVDEIPYIRIMKWM